jgi:hypothetical protein
MKRRIERSRARCEAAERRGSAQIDAHETRSNALTNSFAGVAEKQSSNLRRHAEVEQ